MGPDDICVMGKLRKETFGGRNHRLRIWVGDDFWQLVALLGEQLDPLTKAVQSCTGTLGVWTFPSVDGI